MPRLNVIAIAVLLLLPSAPSFADTASGSSPICVDKACFPSHSGEGESRVPLLGAATLTYYFWDLYTIALYGPAVARNSGSVLADVPKKLNLFYLREIDKKDIINAADEFLKRDPAVDYDAIRERLAKINSWYVSVKEGDRYELEYVPGRGTSLIFNGVTQGTVAGYDFAKAYFGIWLAEAPLDKELRDALFDEMK